MTIREAVASCGTAKAAYGEARQPHNTRRTHAARYLHPRPGDVGKKQLADEAARLADGEWFEDLEYSDGPRRQ